MEYINKIKKTFKKFIINKFVPDYYELIHQNNKLTNDIYNIVINEGEEKGIRSKLYWKCYFNISSGVWNGEGTNDKLQGILNRSKPYEI